MSTVLMGSVAMGYFRCIAMRPLTELLRQGSTPEKKTKKAGHMA
jgi:hypothetical protein